METKLIRMNAASSKWPFLRIIILPIYLSDYSLSNTFWTFSIEWPNIFILTMKVNGSDGYLIILMKMTMDHLILHK
jgi:hypothetical protein